MSVYYLADPADVDTPVVDLNGLLTGDPTGFAVRRLAPGAIQADATFLVGGEVAGGEQVDVRHPPVEGELTLTAQGSEDFEALRALYTTFAQMLNQSSVLVVQADGQDAPVYYDTYRSSIPVFYRGEMESEGVQVIESLLVDAYTFRIWHHPYPRETGVTIVNADDVSNAIGGANLVTGTNPGTAPSEGRLQLTIADDHVVWAVMGVKEGTLEFPSYDLTSVEPVFEAWQMLHRQVLEPTDPAAFEGSYRAIAVYTATEDIFHFEGRYGTSTAGPQANAGTETPVEHDWTDVNSFQPTILDLGLVRYDAQDPRLVIEIWGASDNGADVASWDVLYLIPSDQTYMEMASPGFLSGAYGLARFDGADLDLGGSPDTTDDGSVILEAGQSAFIPALFGDGNAYPVGRRVLELRGTVKNKDRTREKEGELQVFLNGEGSPSITAQVYARRGELVTRWDEDDRRRVTYDVTSTGDHYLEGVEFTEAGGPGKSIHVDRLRTSYIPWVTDGRSMVVDQGRREAFISDDTGAAISKLHRTAALYLPSGDVTLAFLIGVQSPNKYDGVDRRGTLPVIDMTTGTVTLDVTPRRLHP